MKILIGILLLALSNVEAFAFSPIRADNKSFYPLAASVAPESASSKVNDNDSYQPYRGEQPSDGLPEIFIPQVLPGVDDELLWVPQTDCVSFRPLCLCVSGGY